MQGRGLIAGFVHSRAIALVLLSFVALSAAYSFTILTFEAPDENGHVAKINFFLTEGRLPDLDKDKVPIDSEPPLFHATYAAILRTLGYGPIRLNPTWAPSLNRTNLFIHSQDEHDLALPDVQAFHMLRLFSVFLGGITILITYKTGLLLFKRNNTLAVLAAAVNGFIPQFTFISSVINYDVMTSLFSSATIYAFVRIIDTQGFQIRTQIHEAEWCVRLHDSLFFLILTEKVTVG